MRPRRAAKALLAVLGLLAGASAPALAQMNEYEMRYGQTIEVSVDNLLQMPEQYVGKAVRTRAQLEMMPSLNRVYALRGTFGGYLYLYPVPEVAQDFENEMKKFLGKEVEVTGGVGTGKDPNTGQTIVYLQVWAFLGPPDEKPGRRPDTAQVTLEDLVTKAERFDGKLVTVRGQFRGSNLFGDLPSASRQRSSDWVLKEEVFAVWVSGKKAKGEGWTLDPGLRRDTGKWVQVTGRVRVDSRVVTIQATDVVLAKPPSADLWLGQTDEGELGFTYAEVDQLLYLLVDERYCPEECVAAGFDEKFVRNVVERIRRNHFKRILPPIAKLSNRTIGYDFLYLRDWGT